MKEIWSINCEYVAEHDQLMLDKEEEIVRLKARVRELQGDGSTSPGSSQSQEVLSDCSDADSMQGSPQFRETAAMRPSPRGRAPPIDPFTGEDKNVRLEDWVPALERAAQWNGWTESEQLLQLAGHLRGKALQEWNLLQAEEKSSLGRAVKSLKVTG